MSLHNTVSIKRGKVYSQEFDREGPRKVTRVNKGRFFFFNLTSNHSFLNTYYESRTEANKAYIATVFGELRF